MTFISELHLKDFGLSMIQYKGLFWRVVKKMMNSIKWISVRRNAAGRTITNPIIKQMVSDDSLPIGVFIEKECQQWVGLFLKNIRYHIHEYINFIPWNKRNRSTLIIFKN